MNLAFMRKFPKGIGSLTNQPTHFPEKIIRSLDLPEYKLMTQFDLLNEVLVENEILPITDFHSLKPKFHTIRHDSKDRRKVGNDIHFYINSRTKNQFRFAPILKVKSIQKIAISYHNNKPEVFIDGVELIDYEINQLAINDGFNNMNDFFQYFNTDFTGKLIHWTDLKY